MKRIPFEPETFYHLYGHAVGTDNLFREEENYRYFLQKYAHYAPPLLATFAWCLLPNHFHMLVRTPSEETIQRFFSSKDSSRKKRAREEEESLSNRIGQQLGNWLNAYAKAFNRRFQRRGRLFEESLRRKKVTNEEYLVGLVKYLHLNPVRHGFVDSPEDWPYSSFRAVVDDPPNYLEADRVLEWFGGSYYYLRAHKDAVEARNPETRRVLKTRRV